MQTQLSSHACNTKLNQAFSQWLHFFKKQQKKTLLQCTLLAEGSNYDLVDCILYIMCQSKDQKMMESMKEKMKVKEVR